MQYFKRACVLFSLCIAFIVFCGWLMTHTLWTVSTSSLVTLIMAFISVIYLLIKGAKSVHGLYKFLSSLIGAVSFLITALLLCVFLLQLVIMLFGGATHLTTSISPDQRYKINFYYFDAGAMGTFGVRGELDGPFGFEKQMYYERHATEAQVEWLNDYTIRINGNELNLKNGEYFGYVLNSNH